MKVSQLDMEVSFSTENLKNPWILHAFNTHKPWKWFENLSSPASLCYLSVPDSWISINIFYPKYCLTKLPGCQNHPKSFILPSSQASKMQCLHRRWHHGHWWTQQVPQELLLHATRRWGWRWHHLQSVSQSVGGSGLPSNKTHLFALETWRKNMDLFETQHFFQAEKVLREKKKREESQTLWVKNWF